MRLMLWYWTFWDHHHHLVIRVTERRAVRPLLDIRQNRSMATSAVAASANSLAGWIWWYSARSAKLMKRLPGFRLAFGEGSPDAPLGGAARYAGGRRPPTAVVLRTKRRRAPSSPRPSARSRREDAPSLGRSPRRHRPST